MTSPIVITWEKVPSSILIKGLPPYILIWIRFTNERHSTTIGTIGRPKLARALLTLIGSCIESIMCSTLERALRSAYYYCNQFAKENTK